MTGRIIKSRERARKHGEVFTPIWVVDRMLDELVKEADNESPFVIGKTFLEPACGNGVFVGEIVRRKLACCANAGQALLALRDVYAVDILGDNVQQARCQAIGQFLWWLLDRGIADQATLRAARQTVERNIVQGDFLRPETFQVYDWARGTWAHLGERDNA